jgi:RsiW-degrading membrane proteinase PrsW (M82 family)
MTLFLLAIAPGIAICLFIYMKDKFNKEPVKHLIFSFLLGVLSAVPAVIIEIVGSKMLDSWATGHLPIIAHILLQAFVVVALTEEGCKYIMLKKYAFPKKAFDEPFDGIVYSVFVSMGFATIENVGYVMQHGVGTGILRMFLSVPAHGSFAVLMGYYIGMAKFDTANQSKLLWKGLLMATLFHGLFDAFLFLAENKTVTQAISGSLLVLGAIGSYIIAIRLSFKSIRLHRQLSQQRHEQSHHYYSS